MDTQLFKQTAQTMRTLSDRICFRWRSNELNITQVSLNGKTLAHISTPSTQAPSHISVDAEQVYRVSKGIRKDDAIAIQHEDEHLSIQVTNKGGTRIYELSALESHLIAKPNLDSTFHAHAVFDAVGFYRAARELASTHPNVRISTNGPTLSMQSPAEASPKLSVTLNAIEGELTPTELLLSSDQLQHIARFSSLHKTITVRSRPHAPLVLTFGPDALFALKDIAQ
jgi:hypothetical protein